MHIKAILDEFIDLNIERVGKELLIGENQFVSILMSDIRSFTSITEKMPPQELINSLNRYFESMVDVIDRLGGMTDKYIGDAIMALFGAPEKKDDDVIRSVLAGREMLIALDKFNEEQEQLGISPFRIGIGIHYGGVTAGYIGSDKKMDYTVIGEPVNMASRLEGLTKFYGIPLIISETVKRRLNDEVETRLLDKVLVKGSSMPMPIYSVASSGMSPDKKAVWEAFEAGQKEYYDRNFPGAQKEFKDALKAYPDDRPVQIFLERTLEFLKQPPPDDWTGAFRHETKFRNWLYRIASSIFFVGKTGCVCMMSSGSDGLMIQQQRHLPAPFNRQRDHEGMIEFSKITADRNLQLQIQLIISQLRLQRLLIFKLEPTEAMRVDLKMTPLQVGIFQLHPLRFPVG